MTVLESIALGFLLAVVLYLVLKFVRRGLKKGNGGRDITVFSTIEQLKAIGQLSVFKVLTKEIVTEVDHTWGELGKKYLSWILSKKKMAMIFEFEIDFRYDLRSPEFTIEGAGGRYELKMPPCLHEIHIRDIHFYDEQKSKLIPWLLPDLVNTIFGDGFSEEDQNRLKDAAKNRAQRQATDLINTLGSDVEQSAQQTLRSLARAFGAEQVSFTFQRPLQAKPDVDFEPREQVA